MPKLLLFAPCEKVIVNSQDNTTSLITLLETIGLSLSEKELSAVPDDTSLPITWHMLALWQGEQEDYGKKFIQKFHLELPTGEPTKVSGIMPMSFSLELPNFRSIANLLGFPLAPLLHTKAIDAKVSLREEAQPESEWVERGSFRIHVKHGLPSTPNPKPIIIP